ncbi:Holliday junction resolvase RuvX [Pasteuria penetrans]|uniref:Holliday junction resolvase RuvX n=1 Tax=Pasteuria penetrans TaxID=86005 RepID=UPI001FE384A8|nr:Holliday junction resolvase RuvX [Pasteuria penetrans]
MQIEKTSRVMGLDLGDQRIGVAMSDSLRLTAQAITTLSRVAGWYEKLDKIMQAYQGEVEKIIVGLPIQLDGSEGDRARSYRRLAQRLAIRYQCPVDLWDERCSTRAVERVLIQGNVSRRDRRGLTDRLAAVWFLQGYLDAQRGHANQNSGGGRDEKQ